VSPEGDDWVRNVARKLFARGTRDPSLQPDASASDRNASRNTNFLTLPDGVRGSSFAGADAASFETTRECSSAFVDGADRAVGGARVGPDAEVEGRIAGDGGREEAA
jgi:hypothetical protein